MAPTAPQPDAAADPADRDTLALARRVLDAEADAVRGVEPGAAFAAAVSALLAAGESGGVLLVAGVGKSGQIAAKLSATFASTGTPSHPLDPVEAFHGGLGRVRPGDAALLLSHSGDTAEVVALAERLADAGTPIVSITGGRGGELAALSDHALSIGRVVEAPPLGLAPTASTAATLALGDALALCCAARRGFGERDFHRFHGGGGLGRLMTPVAEALRFRCGGASANLAAVPADATVRAGFDAAAAAAGAAGVRRAGALVVVGPDGRLVGVFTDGDLRRLVFRGGDGDPLSRPLAAVMTRDPKHLGPGATMRDAAELVRRLRIDEVPVVDGDNRPIGLLDIQDLVAFRLVDRGGG
ncbi:SIS domain-containing protein [Phycisphaera mikurensis]|uniref:KpsF/GutQ family protein n=1 Tax=Phycisphaera mikurensis (strain NBRC 102666 / KCTC 22515 / FYK2301M01) TaxID=1142394 RepID=I0IHJ1_PHYMF|nr:SIS domain-containing protein [Phycisphaera mikurensis]MBB6440973.1 arabinose-5-phosphate isomerase [Phycisphaera mikurensis]BAM04729.1 KpsF/GutQ family protein [Phycisphaera mikurensis NBRC 102666]